MSLLEESKIIKSYYEYSITIKEFDKLLYETLDHYINYVTLTSEKLSVSRYRNSNTNVSIINDRIIFTHNLHIDNIIHILDYLKIKINSYLDTYLDTYKIIKHIFKMIKINCRLEQITIVPAIKS